nr:hypothetical protein [Tanacetum cinerariifolium]
VAAEAGVHAQLAAPHVQGAVYILVAVAHARPNVAVGALQVILLQHDVDDPARTLGIVLRRRRGNDFDGLNLVGRNLLERVGQ